MSGQLIVVGAGRVGLSLALDLATSLRFDGVTVVGRSPAPPAILESRTDIAYRAVPSGALVPDPPIPGGAADTSLLFCVTDDSLHRLAAAWGGALEPFGGSAIRHAIHTSGLHPGEALAPLRSAGAVVASWHPIVSIAGPRRGAFRLVTFGVEGDEEAVAWARDLGSDLGADSVLVKAGSKPLYHLAAVYGSNYLVACLAVACRQLSASLQQVEGLHLANEAGLALRHLLPLARSALDNLAESGLAAGATGPVTRGDVGTMREHLEALDPTGRNLYRLLAAELFRLRDTELPEDVRAAMSELLAPGEEWEMPPGEGSTGHDE
jgi:predicted short-subunit dehydrogenase-like oxidoreductase (DUF2520 family)